MTTESNTNLEPENLPKGEDTVEPQATTEPEPEEATEHVNSNGETDPADLLLEEKNKYIRLYAEFENFRRRTAKERIELIGTANEDLIKSLLPVLDDFERAIALNKTVEDLEALREGFNLLHQKLNSILTAKGLKPVHVKGDPFDAEIHEAIAQVPTDDASQKGRIIDQVECGYKLHDKTLRHPKVVVAS